MRFLIVSCLVILAFAQSTEAGLMPGGLRKVSPKEVESYVPLIEKTYNLKTQEENYGTVAKIESAETQVIAGQRYVIRFTLGKTDCKKDEVMNGLKAANKDCKQVKAIESCIADVIIRAWEKYVDVSEMKCNDVVTDYYKN